MSPKKKALFISEEISPYIRQSALGELCSDLPAAVAQKGYEARLFMPKYGCINERRNQLHEVIRLSGLNISIDDVDHPLIIKVATQVLSRLQVYFIDNDDYFHHHHVTDIELREQPADNDVRLMFFVRGVAETVKKLRWDPVITQCTGWVTALYPLYMRRVYAADHSLSDGKVVYALYNDPFEGTLNPRFVAKLKLDGLKAADIATLGKEPVDWLTLNRLAIDYADGVVVAGADVPQELIDYAASKEKKILPYVADVKQMAEALVEFYGTL